MLAAGKRFIVYPSRGDFIRLWNLADLHLGGVATRKELLARDIARIAEDPNSFWIGNGDYAEHIGRTDKRFDPSGLDRELRIADLGRLGAVLTEMVANTLKPIANKCLGLGKGNHETAYMAMKEQEYMHETMCRTLGVPDLGYSSLLNLTLVRASCIDKPMLLPVHPGCTGGNEWRLRVFTHHGAGASATTGGRVGRIEKFMSGFDADIYFVAHCHGPAAVPRTKVSLSASGAKLIRNDTIGLMCGTYSDYITSGRTPLFAERQGYAPAPLGARCVSLRGVDREMRAEV